MDVIQYKCPNCGGDLKFDPKSGKYSCEYCRGIFSQDELDRQTLAGTGSKAETKAESGTGVKTGTDAVSKTGSEAGAETDRPDEDTRVYTCPSCGATIVTDSTTAATFCYYCHNPVVLSGRLDGSMRPDYVVPFKIDRRKAEEIFEQWISRRRYVPKSFYSREQIEKFTGVYFPYLMYTCNISGNIDVEGTKKNVYIQGDMEYTDVGVYRVKRGGSLAVRHVLRNALKKANKVLSDSVLPFETDELRPFNMSYLSGFFAEKRDMDKSEMADEMKQEVLDCAVSKLTDSLEGYTDITVSTDNVKLEDEKWEYALLPVWTLTYNDSGKIYYFSINGQTGKTVGELPVDKLKLLTSFFIIFLILLTIFLVLFYFII